MEVTLNDMNSHSPPVEHVLKGLPEQILGVPKKTPSSRDGSGSPKRRLKVR